jgi:hypothetical protein
MHGGSGTSVLAHNCHVPSTPRHRRTAKSSRFSLLISAKASRCVDALPPHRWSSARRAALCCTRRVHRNARFSHGTSMWAIASSSLTRNLRPPTSALRPPPSSPGLTPPTPVSAVPPPARAKFDSAGVRSGAADLITPGFARRSARCRVTKPPSRSHLATTASSRNCTMPCVACIHCAIRCAALRTTHARA